MQTKITRSAIDKIPLPLAGYALVWDSELANFGIRITAAGSRAYIVQRRVNGKDRRITIGKAEVFTPEQARTQARKLLGQIAEGRDPNAERAAIKAKGVTLAQAFAAYLEARRNLKPLTVADMQHAMRDLKTWQAKPLNTISADMVARKHKELGQRSEARANLTMRYLRAILNFAAEKFTDADGASVLPVNPVRKLSKTKGWYHVERRKTFIKQHELTPWMQAVLALESGGVRDYLMLTLLTGLRRSEGLGLLWKDVDLQGRKLTVRDTKNHESHTLPLPDYLLQLLKARQRAAAGEYVFESPRGRLSNLRFGLNAVQSASGVDFCIHDLRRTFATAADALDVPAYAVKALLNHKTTGDVTAGYVQVTTERLRAPMQKIADYFLAAGGVRSSADVVPFPSNAGRSKTVANKLQ